RSTMALFLLLVFFLGQIALVPAVIIQVASMSSEHQMLILDQKVVLHHDDRSSEVHHGLDRWIVALTHTSSSGDHVLPWNELETCELCRDRHLRMMTKPLGLSRTEFLDFPSILPDIVVQGDAIARQHRVAEMMITQWTSVRLLV
ncbi:MAG: hypothetical protein RLZZ553_1010, partial [Verrucomicrobiota bacterium]